VDILILVVSGLGVLEEPREAEVAQGLIYMEEQVVVTLGMAQVGL
jgi:hypothetical protein